MAAMRRKAGDAAASTNATFSPDNGRQMRRPATERVTSRPVRSVVADHQTVNSAN